MIVETVYAGRDNVFSLQLLRSEVPVNLLAVTGYELRTLGGLVFNDIARFNEKEDGVVEISIGDLLTPEDRGNHIAYLVTFDPVNVNGVQWPNFKLKVR